MARGFGTTPDQRARSVLVLVPSRLLIELSGRIHVRRAPEHATNRPGIFWLFKEENSANARESARASAPVCARASTRACVPPGEESTLICVSEESVIEQKPFSQQVETVTRRRGSTRGDKEARALF